MINIKKLIEDVIGDLANNQPLDSVSSKVQVISRSLRNDKFNEWVDCEFTKGYPKSIPLPAYRKFFILGVQASYVAPYGFGGAVKYTNQQVPIENLGADRYRKIAEVTITEPISIVQRSIHPDRNIHLSIGPHESSYIQEVLEGCQIMNMHKLVSIHQFQNIIDQTKAILIDFFIELNDTILNNEIDFNVMNRKDEIERAVANTIYAGVVNTGTGTIKIDNSNIIGGQNNTVTISAETKQQLNEIVRQIETISQEVDDDRTDIADAILTIREELDSKTPRLRFLKTAFNGLKAIGAGVIVDKITPLVDKGLELIQKL